MSMVGKEGCETMPCKSDFTDTTSQPDQIQYVQND